MNGKLLTKKLCFTAVDVSGRKLCFGAFDVADSLSQPTELMNKNEDSGTKPTCETWWNYFDKPAVEVWESMTAVQKTALSRVLSEMADDLLDRATVAAER